MNKEKNILVPESLIKDLYSAINNQIGYCIGCSKKSDLKATYEVFNQFENWYLEKENKKIKRDLYKIKKNIE